MWCRLYFDLVFKIKYKNVQTLLQFLLKSIYLRKYILSTNKRNDFTCFQSPRGNYCISY